jgi:hypothetical protein
LIDPPTNHCPRAEALALPSTEWSSEKRSLFVMPEPWEQGDSWCLCMQKCEGMAVRRGHHEGAVVPVVSPIPSAAVPIGIWLLCYDKLKATAS